MDLESNELFAALTVPPMVGGVTLEAYGFNMAVSICALIATGNILYALVYVPLHAICYAICRNDSSIFRLLWVKKDLPAMPNKNAWGVRTYGPF